MSQRHPAGKINGDRHGKPRMGFKKTSRTSHSMESLILGDLQLTLPPVFPLARTSGEARNRGELRELAHLQNPNLIVADSGKKSGLGKSQK